MKDLTKKKKNCPCHIFFFVKHPRHINNNNNKKIIKNKKKKTSPFICSSLSLFSNVVECMRKNSNNIRIQKLRTHNIPSNSSKLFHPNSNQHYLFPHLLFHILNSSQWLGIFLSKLVSFSPKFIYYFINLIILCIVLSQLHIL